MRQLALAQDGLECQLERRFSRRFDAAFESVFSAMGYGAVPLCTFRFCLQPATGIQAEGSRASAIGLP